MTTLYGADSLDPTAETTDWDAIERAYAYGEGSGAVSNQIEYTSDAFAQPESPELAPIPEPPPLVDDTYSYAEPTPAEYVDYSEPAYGPPAPVEAYAPEPVFDVPTLDPMAAMQYQPGSPFVVPEDYTPQGGYVPTPGLSPEWQALSEMQYYGDQPDAGADYFPPDPGSDEGWQFIYDAQGNIIGRQPYAQFPPPLPKGPNLIGPPAPGVVYNPDMPLDTSQVIDRRGMEWQPNSAERALLDNNALRLVDNGTGLTPYELGQRLGGLVAPILGASGSANYGAGNINLSDRPVVHNPDGTISTVRSISIEEDGKEVLIPTVSPDGRILSDAEAIDLYHQTGQYLGKFDSVQAADAYARQLHEEQASEYGGLQPEREPFFGDYFADSDARFDASVDPNNYSRQHALDPIGAGLSWATTPLGPLKTIADFGANAVNRNMAIQNQAANPFAVTNAAGIGTEGGVGEPVIGDIAGGLVPQSPLDLFLTALPAAAALPEGGLSAAAREAIGFGGGQATEALEDLPAAALRGAARRFPESPGMAADVANVTRQIAGGAPDAVEEATKVVGDMAGNIRLSKLPEDIRGTVAEWAAENPDLVDAARRGVRSDAQVLDDARSLVNDLGGDFNKIQKSWKPGDAWNAETITAIRGALNDSTQKVLDAAALVRSADSTENQLNLANAILEQNRIQQIVTGVTAESGRALRAFRQDAPQALANGDVARMQQILKQAIGSSDNVDIAKLSDAIRALDLNDPMAVNTFLRNVNKPGWADMLTEYFYNSILSGPWTHARNAIGNTASTMTEPIRRASSAALEAGVSRIQGRAPQRFWEEAPASIVGAVHGIPEGIRGALTTMRTGFSPDTLSRVELGRRSAIPGPIGTAIRIPSTALEAADSLFYAINYRGSLYANATRAARGEGLVGSALTDRVAQLIASPTAGLVKQSANDAERMLFRNDPGGFTKWLIQGKEKFPALNLLIPFAKTPSNILKFGIRNSPIGLLDVPMWRRVLSENPEGVDELAQTLVGSAVALGMASLVANGQMDITAGVPTNAADRDAFYRAGKLPFSVKLPGVGWVQYNQIPGLDTTLTSLAAVVEGARNGDNVDDIAAQTGATIAQSLLDRSYMSGLSDFMDAVGDPARFAARYASRQANTAVPYSSFFRQVAQAIDPTVRTPESLADTFKAGIPGLSRSVPPQLTAFGEEAQRGFPSPIQISPERASAVDAELDRLGSDVTFVGKSIGGHKLSSAEQRDYQKLAGQKTLEILDALIQDPRYEALDDAGKQKIIDKAISLARDDARDILSANNYRIPENER